MATATDLASLLDRFVEATPAYITHNQLQSYNTFVQRQMRKTIADITPRFKMTKNIEGRMYGLQVVVGGDEHATAVFLDKPSIISPETGVARPMYPNEARLHGLNYVSYIYADIKLEFSVDGNVVGDKTFPRHRLGTLPVMLQSEACILSGGNPELLREMGECPFDQGGYFILGGREKVIVAQEEGVFNRLFVSPGSSSDPKVEYEGRLQTIPAGGGFPKTMRLYIYKNDRSQKANHIDVEVRGLVGRVPLFLLFRAMGVESDRDIMTLIAGSETVETKEALSSGSMLGILRSCALDAATSTGVFDQITAAEALMGRTDYKTIERLRHVIDEDILANVEDGGLDAKATYLGNVVRKFLRVVTKADPMPDRDSYENKRIHAGGLKLSHLFRDKYRVFFKSALSDLDRTYYNGAWQQNAELDMLQLVNASNVHLIFNATHLDKGLVDAFRGSWNVDDTAPEGHKDDLHEKGVVQDLNRMSYMMYVSHLRRVNGQLKNSGGDEAMKLRPPHLLYNTHWGVICPVESPDGINIGILKHLAGMCQISPDLPPKDLVRHMVVDLGLVTAPRAHYPRYDKKTQDTKTIDVTINNNLIGSTTMPALLERYLIALRRNGLLHPLVSVKWEVMRNEIQIFSDAGRCCRPLLITESAAPPEVPGQTKTPVTLRARSDVGMGMMAAWDTALLGDTLLSPASRKTVLPVSTGFSTSILHPEEFSRHAAQNAADVPAAVERLTRTAGIVEFLDVEESNARLIAMTPHDLEQVPCQRYTHCEIHPSTILSLPAACVPFMDRNPSPRNVYSMAQSKQAMSLPTTTLANRMDTMAGLLNYPQRPLISTHTAERMFGGSHAYGQNAIVAIASFTGYNQEDSVIINKSAVDRGLFNITYYHTLQFEDGLSKGGEEQVLIRNPLTEEEGHGIEFDEAARARLAHLRPDGLPQEGSYLMEGDVLVGRVHISETLVQTTDSIGIPRITRHVTKKDASVKVEKGGEGRVDRSFRSNITGVCKVRMSQQRLPEFGDKFASRHAQKGVVGMMVASNEMPYSAITGVAPDIIINPHAIPSRMTVGHLLECLLGKTGGMAGTRFKCNTFDRADVQATADLLGTEFDMSHHGDEIMYNGRTGEQLEVPIFVGPTYYMRLKHMVADKINHRSTGPVSALTRQPTQGRGKHGGLRVGEMEKDALLSHGASGFLKESFMERSDAFQMILDADTGEFVSHGRARGPWAANLQNMKIPYAFKLATQELRAMAIDLKFVTGDIDDGEEAMTEARLAVVRNMDVEPGDMDDSTYFEKMKTTDFAVWDTSNYTSSSSSSSSS